MTAQLYSQVLNIVDAAVAVAIDAPSAEETIVLEKLCEHVSIPLNLPIYTWDLALGFQEVQYKKGAGIEQVDCSLSAQIGSLGELITFVRATTTPGIYVLVDIHYSISTDHVYRRAIKCCIDSFALTSDKRLIFLGQGIEVPKDLDGRLSLVTIPLPTGEEIQQEINNWLPELADCLPADAKIPEETMTSITRAWQGLTIREGVNILREVALSQNTIGEPTSRRLHEYKIQKLKSLGIEVLSHPKEKVGGLVGINNWLSKRKDLLVAVETEETPRVKGVALIGFPGTGKSLIARSVAAELGVPCFVLNMTSMLGSLVGESEAKTKAVLDMVSAAAPGVLLIDEVDKTFGSNSDNDGGVTKRVFGQLLTWLNDNTAPVFTIATANDVKNLPPEFLRKGRFSEIFFVELPVEQERVSIFQIHLNRWCKVSPEEILDLAQKLAVQTPDYSGAEIADIVQSAALEARADNRIGKITLQDLTFARGATNPLAEQKRADLLEVRERCANFARANAVANTINSTPKYSRTLPKRNTANN